jgi:hypothetical protein
MLVLLLLATRPAVAAELQFKDRVLADLVTQVPGILKTYDPQTGRFGCGIWICTDQNAMYPLAAAFATKAPGNPYYQDPKLLDVIMKAGDALIDDMNSQGQWVFRKKDNSTWGNIRMPWTYSRWIRSFQLIREAMPADRRKRWSEALTFGYSKIAQSDIGHVHNIPSHHAMGLYVAGKALDRPEWCQKAAEFLAKVIAQQAEGGYWSEGVGPVVAYDFVYVEAIGTYYAMSGDKRVLPALEKAATFHRHFTYPGGQNVETVDQRNPYHAVIASGNVGFSVTPIGRAYLLAQWSLHKGPLDADQNASFLLYGEEGPIAEASAGQRDETFALTEGGVARAATVQRGPWFVCLSAYTAPISKSRWIQDRQNLVSIYHDKLGLIVGGGNTKLQPDWSTFTVGAPSLLAHRVGDTNPDFLPKGKLYHVPSAANLAVTPEPSLQLTYGPETCSVRVVPKDERSLEYVVETSAAAELPICAHLTLIPQRSKPLETAAGQRLTLGDKPITLGGNQLGSWIGQASYRVHLPSTATLVWPVLPHNPYTADGHATLGEARLVIRLPLDREHRQCRVLLEVVE